MFIQTGSAKEFFFWTMYEEMESEVAEPRYRDRAFLGSLAE